MIFVIDDLIDVNKVRLILPLLKQFLTVLDDMKIQAILVSNFSLLESSLAFELDLSSFTEQFMPEISKNDFFSIFFLDAKKEDKANLMRHYDSYAKFFNSITTKRDLLSNHLNSAGQSIQNERAKVQEKIKIGPYKGEIDEYLNSSIGNLLKRQPKRKTKDSTSCSFFCIKN